MNVNTGLCATSVVRVGTFGGTSRRLRASGLLEDVDAVQVTPCNMRSARLTLKSIPAIDTCWL